jgi:hypothetical protein
MPVSDRIATAMKLFSLFTEGDERTIFLIKRIDLIGHESYSVLLINLGGVKAHHIGEGE